MDLTFRFSELINAFDVSISRIVKRFERRIDGELLLGWRQFDEAVLKGFGDAGQLLVVFLGVQELLIQKIADKVFFVNICNKDAMVLILRTSVFPE